MEEIKLKRSGRRPIVFIGEEVGYLSDKEIEDDRWTVARVFRVQDGGYVVGIAKMTNYLNERDSYDIKKMKTLEEVEQHIKQQEPWLFELMTTQQKIGPNSVLDPAQENQIGKEK